MASHHGVIPEGEGDGSGELRRRRKGLLGRALRNTRGRQRFLGAPLTIMYFACLVAALMGN